MNANRWQLQEAKNKLSQVIDLAINESPQLITKNGKEVVYIVSVEEYKARNKPSILGTILNRPHKDIDLELGRDMDTGRDIVL